MAVRVTMSVRARVRAEVRSWVRFDLSCANEVSIFVTVTVHVQWIVILAKYLLLRSYVN